MYAIAPSNSRMAALIAGLKSGHIRAAGLDVYDGEPKVNLTLENVTLPGARTATTSKLQDIMRAGTELPGMAAFLTAPMFRSGRYGASGAASTEPNSWFSQTQCSRTDALSRTCSHGRLIGIVSCRDGARVKCWTHCAAASGPQEIRPPSLT